MSEQSISELCEKKLWELFNRDHSGEIGGRPDVARQFPARQPIDCITFVRNVVAASYEQTGKPEIAKAIRNAKDPDGHLQGKYMTLVLQKAGWRTYYWNPDIRHPRDGEAEHPARFRDDVLGRHEYSGVKLDGLIVQYNRQNPKSLGNNQRAFDRLSQVKFAFGGMRGWYHNFIFSKGMAFEVHWDETDPNKIYERKPFWGWKWEDGILAVPPDDSFRGDPIRDDRDRDYDLFGWNLPSWLR